MSGSDSDQESSVEKNAAAATAAAKARHRQEEIEIDVLKAKVLDMPEITEGMLLEERRRIADLKRSLWNKVVDRSWILEQQRVRECVDNAKELGLTGPPDAIECLFCCEDISGDISRIYACCGKNCCLSCDDKWADNWTRTSVDTCPFCRANTGLSDIEFSKHSIERAQSGDAVSQYQTGINYTSGSGVVMDMNKARYWFKCAALQGVTHAQTSLGRMYTEGHGGEQSYSEAERFLKMAAKKSCPEALLRLGYLMRRQGRTEEVLQCFTLSAAQGSIHAQKELADWYESESTYNNILSFYWCKKGALAGDEDCFIRTSHRLLRIMSECIGKDWLNSSTMVKEVGRNAIPEVLFWLRKATSVQESNFQELAAEDRVHCETIAREWCSGCWELAGSFDDKFKACRCHAAFYCSKKCQIEHWKGGHVLDCCDKDGKFHPCPNDDKYN